MAIEQEIERVRDAVRSLPDEKWPGGYSSLALCIIDAVYSVNARYESVKRTVATYRAAYPDADRQGVSELLHVIHAAGGADAFAEHVLKNRQRTSTRNGILKAEAVADAASALAALGIDTVEAVRALSADQLARLEQGWTSIKGQRSGVTFRYFLMLANVPGVKPDRMILRFLGRILGRTLSRDEAVEIVTTAADGLGLAASEVDHRIWAAERQRRHT